MFICVIPVKSTFRFAHISQKNCWKLSQSIHSYFTELIVAVGDQLEHIVGRELGSKLISLGNYVASMPVALTHDPVSRKLFFSDRYQRHTHIFSVSLDHAGDSPAVTSVINSKDSFI